MKVFHGSNVFVKEPRLLVPNRTLDFGPGFYTTTNQKQAEDFARKVYERELTGKAGDGRFVSVYNVEYEHMKKELAVLRFEAPDAVWFDFVLANRRGVYEGPRVDVIYGPVANDTVYRCLVGYQAGLYSKEETIERLKVRKLYDQMVFATEKALSYLRFESFLEVCP
ncbi:MAG: DUF3990 domain-containing protein [Synergistaceae bacterium]|jgi:hypothetical protein|nr:DUF3990 domain-containing protein [Synergistaceae bacterium]